MGTNTYEYLTSISEFASADMDLCSPQQIHAQFPNRFIEVSSLKVTFENVKCSSLFCDDFESKIASVLSNRSVVVIDRELFKVLNTFTSHKERVTDIRFSPLNSNLLYVGSCNGQIGMWDLRTETIERTINFNNPQCKKPISTFDISPTERLLCAGTELTGIDSFLLFWDLRGDELLGGYWQSHSDDITKVRFNPKDSNCLVSSGADGLMNVFDISSSSEENTLTYCLNTSDVVDSFSMRTENNKSHILAYTDAHSVQLWDIEEAAPMHSYSRDKITKTLLRKYPYECYTVPIHHNECFEKNPVILAGSGMEHKSICLRLLKINEKSGNLEPYGLLVNKDNSLSSYTQVASFCPAVEELVTIREDGVVSMWKRKDSMYDESFKLSRCKEKIKSKPY